MNTNKKTFLSFVIPCLNESMCLQGVLDDCHEGGKLAQMSYEVIVADNGSSDGSQEIALANGAKLINVDEKGYGAALKAGLEAAEGDFIIMGDADGTYNFKDAPLFLDQLFVGADLVMGNRFKGFIQPGAMPILHRWFGNPILSGIGSLFFGIPIGDFHCGLRAFKSESIKLLGLKSNGMEFASEMVIKASLRDLKLVEVPTSLSLDHPERTPHLRTWRDGWRHLKFMLSFSPKYSFLFFAFLLFCFSGLSLLSFAFNFTRASGPNTLVISLFLLFSGLFVFSDYLTTRTIFAETYGKPSLFASWLQKYPFRGEQGVDTIYQVSGFAFLVGLAIFISSISAFINESPSTKIENIIIYLGCFSWSVALTCYLTAAKISTIRSIRN
ncbi:Undecaprenyl-phosphate 4-deoxy-4-formamido-L-arabinose transferase [Prochlorococcus marinus str. MIT 1313]|uniref:glycosyltransferase family 2 protein n=1 Tax=Prochlorococcus marinus TaxID=1219 RepID=UPI0007B37EF3|nr:glycosyltransferase family 2 protein [Prochlorococcus marinus]KZR72065.1 Undecaprenyl-phosphate 4-deoxy-4-formamido-L-arabinose transferase [Prochlorococcus marinus str. MIT 1313]KZR74625.1 Undecaprenyl-phosphate 4-deoxy-4-formamido-L-arabinose transferase [Prochlorococcus marinus str. MIT 1318]